MKYENVTKKLLQQIPAFAEERSSDKSFMSHGDDSPYLVYGDFGIFLLQYLNTASEQTKDETLLRKASELLSEMLTSSDPEVVNLAQVGVLETIADSPKAFAILKKHMSSNATEVLQQWLQH